MFGSAIRERGERQYLLSLLFEKCQISIQVNSTHLPTCQHSFQEKGGSPLKLYEVSIPAINARLKDADNGSSNKLQSALLTTSKVMARKETVCWEYGSLEISQNEYYNE